VRGNKTIIDAIRNKIGLKDSQRTTKDMRYTLETVSCLGACGLAPAVVINDKIYGHMTPDKVVAAIDELEKEAAN
jgi:NADH-quinone oxidoreductase subunit E